MNRKNIGVIVPILIVVELSFLFLTCMSYSNKDVDKIKEEYKVDKKMFAMYTENEDGTYSEYTSSNYFPSGYNINLEKSNCVDNKGNKIEEILTGSGNKITVSSNKTVFCYLYFSLPIPDIKVNGVDTTKLATAKYTKSIDCGSTGSASYDSKYQRFEFSSVTAPASCTINYTEDTASYPKLNQTIKDMAVEGTNDGTGQETGDVVHEIANITIDNSAFTPSTTLSESDYTITTMETTSDNKNAFIWDSSTNTWTSQNKTDGTTSGVGMSFTVAEGYYQLCYTMSSEKKYDYGIVYIDGTKKFETKGKDTNTYCEYLGKITSSNVIKVTYRKDSSGSSGNDNILFYLQSGTYVEDITTETFDTGYRYEGKSPNNYIWFNNELWRIIGVFDACTALDDSGNCTTTETLTKIMRNELIGGLVWDKSDNNNWPDSSLYKLLNTNYLNSTNGTDSGYCYGYQTTVTTNCDYSEIGLKGTSSYYGSMIKNVVWNLGGMSTTSGAENYLSGPASTWYKYERGTIVYSGRDTKTTGYIGLMYGSDYGYSVKASSNCNRSTSLNSYNTAYCSGASWMYGQGDEWMITPHSTYSSNGLRVGNSGSVSYSGVGDALVVRPVLYLDATTYVINGEEDDVGSISNPYQIAK